MFHPYVHRTEIRANGFSSDQPQLNNHLSQALDGLLLSCLDEDVQEIVDILLGKCAKIRDIILEHLRRENHNQQDIEELERAIREMHSAITNMSTKLAKQVKNAVHFLEHLNNFGNAFDETLRKVEQIRNSTTERIEVHCKKIIVLFPLRDGIEKHQKIMNAQIQEAASLFKSTFDEIKNMPRLSVGKDESLVC